MRRFSRWPLRPFDGPELDFPDALLTAPVGGPPGDMPPAVALLLPTARGAQDAVADLDDMRPAGIALFLADPNLVIGRLSRQVARRTDWACNFPSVGQHEHEFRRYLAEVDLDHAREMRMLSHLGAAGVSTIATVSAVRDLAAALAARPAALLVVPPVPDFAAGDVPLSDRVALEHAVAAGAGDLPVIGLRAPGEAAEGAAAGLLPPDGISP